MTDYSHITSVRAADSACDAGELKRVLLLPVEFGGQDVPQNVTYLTVDAWKTKMEGMTGLLEAINSGMHEVQIVPRFNGPSFVPNSLEISASRPGRPPEYELQIRVW